MIKAGQLAHPGVAENRLVDLDCLNSFQIASEGKTLKEFRREEAALQRSMAASYREYAMLRKLDPRPKSPLTQNARIIGPSQAPAPLAQMTEESVNLQPADLIEPSDMPIDNQSQVETVAVTPESGFSASFAPQTETQGKEMAFAAG